MTARLGALLVALALAGCAGESGVSFPGKVEGAAAVTLRGTLYKPEGPGPFSAVVLLHGCSGIGPATHGWGQRLASWGYVALVTDSFGPRGYATVCGQGRAVDGVTRAGDAAAAADYLRTQGFVRGDRIGVVGFSHGGWTTMELARREQPAGAFRAAVAYYPSCWANARAKPLLPTLVLIGADDDWTPAEPCRQLGQIVGNEARLQVVVYPKTVHAFESASAVGFMNQQGHWLKGNSVSAADSFDRTRAFLDRWLKS